MCNYPGVLLFNRQTKDIILGICDGSASLRMTKKGAFLVIFMLIFV